MLDVFAAIATLIILLSIAYNVGWMRATKRFQTKLERIIDNGFQRIPRKVGEESEGYDNGKNNG